MRCDKATRLLVVAIGTLAILTAQTKIDLSSQARRIDFSNAPAVKPIPVGSALPATCGLGEMFFKRDANAGENLYVCPAQNIWTQISGTATSLHPGTAGGILISNTAANFDVDADTMFLASQAGNNVFTGHNDFSGAASLRIWTGSVEPPADGCDTSSETGNIYMLTGASTKASLLYVCQATSDGYSWRPATYAYDTVAPSTCVTGQVFFDTDATPGQNWLGCTATNTWTVLGSAARSYAQGTTPPASCVIGDAFFDTDATPGQNWLGCTATNTWTVLGSAARSYAQGTTPPASCVIGDAFFDTDATSGENWLGCTATNTWSALGKRHDKGTTAPATCVVGDVFFDTDATAGENWLGCTATNTWTLLGTPASASTRLLSWQKQSPATTLTGAETVVASTVVPGGTIPSGACLKFRAGFQHTTGTASIEYRLRYGSAYLVALPSTTSSQIVRLEGYMCNDPGATGTQQIAAGYMLSTANSAEQMTTMAVNSTSDQVFSLAAVGPISDAVTLRYFMVEVLK